MMFVNHIIKTIEYFAVCGIPEVSLEDLPTLMSYWMKLGYIYITYFIENL